MTSPSSPQSQGADGPYPSDPPVDSSDSPAASPEGQPAAEQEQPGRKSRSIGKVILGGVGAVALMLVIRLVIVPNVFGGDDIPEAGECLTDAPLAADMEIVDCADGGAAWEVLGSDGEMTKGAFDQAPGDEVCGSFAGSWEQALWFGPDSGGKDADGEVICLSRTG